MTDGMRKHMVDLDAGVAARELGRNPPRQR